MMLLMGLLANFMVELSPLFETLYLTLSSIFDYFFWCEPLFCQRRWLLSFIKDGLKPVHDAHVFPVGWRLHFIGVYRLKPIIKDDMVLRREVTRLKVPDHCYVLSMNRGDADILASSRSGLPLRNFGSCGGQPGI
jgi:hypothetical protein